MTGTSMPLDEAQVRPEGPARTPGPVMLYQRPGRPTGMRAGLVGRPRAKSIRYQRPGLAKNGQRFGPLVLEQIPFASEHVSG